MTLVMPSCSAMFLSVVVPEELELLEELPELPDASQEGGQLTLELEAAVARLRAEEEQGAGLPAEDGP